MTFICQKMNFRCLGNDIFMFNKNFSYSMNYFDMFNE